MTATTMIERAAFALWRDESIRAATRPRTPEQWLDESEETRDRWRRVARAALDACHAEEMRSMIGKLMAACVGTSDFSTLGIMEEAETLLAKQDAKP